MLCNLHHLLNSNVICNAMTWLLWQMIISSHVSFFNRKSPWFLSFCFFTKFISQVLQKENTQVLSTVLCVVSCCSQMASVVLFPSGTKPQTPRHRSSTASCWSRTCSTAVHRTCGYRRHAGGPSDTSWNGLRSIHLQREPKKRKKTQFQQQFKLRLQHIIIFTHFFFSAKK